MTAVELGFGLCVCDRGRVSWLDPSLTKDLAMLTLREAIPPVLIPFATLFRGPTWRKAQVLLVGAVLAPGQRTVASALRVMGLSGDRNYAHYHHVLNRAEWSVSQVLLVLLIRHLDRGDDPLIFGIDETLERRRGPQINFTPSGLAACLRIRFWRRQAS